MKHINLLLKLASCIVLFLILMLASCTTEEMEDPEPDEPDTIEIPSVDANKVTESIKLKNGVVVPGKIAPFTKVADVKIDQDTIFVVKDLKARIRIKKGQQVHYGGLTMQVANSNSHIRAEFEEEEETDSTAVFYFEFDEEPDWDPPLSFNIKIVPEDENGVPQDSINLPVGVEEPIADGGAGCSFENYWEWMYNTEDGKVSSVAGVGTATISQVKGCCIEGVSVYSGSSWVCPTEEHRSVEYVTVFRIEFDFLLFNEGKAYGGMLQFTQNLKIETTDFCSMNPGYNKRNTVNEYESAYTVDGSNCTLTIAGFEGKSESIYDDYGNYYGEAPLPVYAGSGYGVEYKLISKHFMEERRNVEGTSFLRLYRAPFEGVVGVPDTKDVTWYD